ncbi:hypothetical protein RRG08_058687 [Elysia crispata]|uniref:Secreted protein n=1 Tax=Elysia crispata TaxID=231223 RepID=A0AAE1D5V2_9GAST|nr:hypothetical protein RRG08_058687 [Elysia crispata]
MRAASLILSLHLCEPLVNASVLQSSLCGLGEALRGWSGEITAFISRSLSGHNIRSLHGVELKVSRALSSEVVFAFITLDEILFIYYAYPRFSCCRSTNVHYRAPPVPAPRSMVPTVIVFCGANWSNDVLTSYDLSGVGDTCTAVTIVLTLGQYLHSCNHCANSWSILLQL